MDILFHFFRTMASVPAERTFWGHLQTVIAVEKESDKMSRISRLTVDFKYDCKNFTTTKSGRNWKDEILFNYVYAQMIAYVSDR